MLSKLNINENDVIVELRKRKIQRNYCFYNYREGINLKQINNFNIIHKKFKNNNTKNFFSSIIQNLLKLICIDVIKN